MKPFSSSPKDDDADDAPADADDPAADAEAVGADGDTGAQVLDHLQPMLRRSVHDGMDQAVCASKSSDLVTTCLALPFGIA